MTTAFITNSSNIKYTLPPTHSPPIVTNPKTAQLLHMASKQKHRALKLNPVQQMCQESSSSTMSEAISLHKEDHVVEEKQSYAMVTGLLQVMVHMRSPGTRRLSADISIWHQGGQHCLSTVLHMCCISFYNP